MLQPQRPDDYVVATGEAHTVREFVGCDASVAERVLSGDPFRPSENDYDWLGSGI